jgi:hypothetical protein
MYTKSQYPTSRIPLLCSVVETLLLITLILVGLYCICNLITVDAHAQSAVTLAWDANTEASVAGYKVYYGTASRVYGTPIDVGKVTTYKVPNLTCGTKLYFTATAYANTVPVQESGYSNEVSITLLCAPANFKIVSTSVVAIAKKDATLLAFTSLPATSTVTYTSRSVTPKVDHSIHISGLKPHTLYTYTWSATSSIDSSVDTHSGAFSTN